MLKNKLIFFKIFIEYIDDYFVYICIGLLIKHSVKMKTKKEFKYHLKKDVRDDLENLYIKISALLHSDDEGFANLPTYKSLPELFKVYTHLCWVRSYHSWFKKVYE